MGAWGADTFDNDTACDWAYDLVASAIAAIDRILSAQSELRELWDEDGENKEWHEAMNDLRSRVAS